MQQPQVVSHYGGGEGDIQLYMYCVLNVSISVLIYI